MKIEIINIYKSFGNLTANSNINISIESGIHALLGENGAGKSTLVKIISGQLNPDKGKILIDNNYLKLGSPKTSVDMGIGLLNQDPLDFSNLSVFESFLVGIKEKNLYKNLKDCRKKIINLLTKYKVNIKLEDKTSNLSIGQRQQIELIRLLYNGAKIIILDEPTSAFSLEQKTMMFQTLRQLSEEGMTIIFVSHKLDEIMEICDSGTILKSGKVIHKISKPFDADEIINIMFEKNNLISPEQKKINSNENFNILVSEKDKSKKNILNKYSFPIGSVIGFAGLQGSYNDLFVKNFFSKEFSETKIENSEYYFSKNIYYYMPADRLEKGLFNELNLLEHFALSASSESNFIDWNKVKKLADTKIKKFNIKGNYNTQINELSGGNQQRLMHSLIPDNQSILLLEQPTRGLDFSSAKTIWEMILTRKNKDIAILFSSTDIDEIWEYSDIIFSISGRRIMDINYSKNLTKDMVKNYVSGIA